MDRAYQRVKSGVQTSAIPSRAGKGPRAPGVNPELVAPSYEAQSPGPALSPSQCRVLRGVVAGLCGFAGVYVDPLSRGVYVVAGAQIEYSGAVVVAMARQPVIHTCTARVAGPSYAECVSAARTVARNAAIGGACRVSRHTGGAVELMGSGALGTLDEVARLAGQMPSHTINMLSVGYSAISFLCCHDGEVRSAYMTPRSALFLGQHLPHDFVCRQESRGGKPIVELRCVNGDNDCTPLVIGDAGSIRISGSHRAIELLAAALGDTLRSVLTGPHRDLFLRTLQLGEAQGASPTLRASAPASPATL